MAKCLAMWDKLLLHLHTYMHLIACMHTHTHTSHTLWIVSFPDYPLKGVHGLRDYCNIHMYSIYKMERLSCSSDHHCPLFVGRAMSSCPRPLQFWTSTRPGTQHQVLNFHLIQPRSWVSHVLKFYTPLLQNNESYAYYLPSSATGHCPVLLRGLKKVASGSEEVLTYLKEQVHAHANLSRYTKLSYSFPPHPRPCPASSRLQYSTGEGKLGGDWKWG